VGSYCPGTTLKILGQNGEFNFHLKLQRGWILIILTWAMSSWSTTQ
jgi:hypothetical protein